MDDANPSGKRGLCAADKTPFVTAVSTGPEGRPRKLELAPVKGFRKREIALGAKRWLAPGSEIVADSHGCWNVFAEPNTAIGQSARDRDAILQASFGATNGSTDSRPRSRVPSVPPHVPNYRPNRVLINE